MWSRIGFACGIIVIKRKNTAKSGGDFSRNGGPNRDRTDDLTDANRTLSPAGQWYAPKRNSEKRHNLSQKINKIRKVCVFARMSGVFCRKSFGKNTAHLFPEMAFWDATWLADNGGTGLHFCF